MKYSGRLVMDAFVMWKEAMPRALEMCWSLKQLMLTVARVTRDLPLSLNIMKESEYCLGFLLSD